MNTQGKRTCRQLSQETKDKISRTMKNKAKSSTHKAHISQSLKKYWEQIPTQKENNDLTMQNNSL